MSARPLERAIEVVLTAGLLASASLLLGGLALDRPGLLRGGLLILMMTPLARLVVLTVGLLHDRDWIFAAVSLWVLLVIVSGMWVAGHLGSP